MNLQPIIFVAIRKNTTKKNHRHFVHGDIPAATILEVDADGSKKPGGRHHHRLLRESIFGLLRTTTTSLTIDQRTKSQNDSKTEAAFVFPWVERARKEKEKATPHPAPYVTSHFLL
jgi:hypothetical protein